VTSIRELVVPVSTTVRGLATELGLGAAEGPVGQAGQVGDDRWPEFCAAMANVMACPSSQ
jgi:hypothetical protein